MKFSNFLGWGVSITCTLSFLIVGILLIVNRDAKFWDAKGTVINAEYCQIEHCTYYNYCTYLGNVTLEYDYEDRTYVSIVNPDQACGPNCCSELVESQEIVYLTLDSDDPKIVLLFEQIDLARQNGVILTLGIFAILIGCIMIIGTIYIYAQD